MENVISSEPSSAPPPSKPEPRKLLTKRRVALAVLAFTAVGAIAAVFALLLPDTTDTSAGQDQSASANGSGNGVIQSGRDISVVDGCITLGGQCVVGDQASDTDIREALSELPENSQPPAGSGPWPFIVVDTMDGAKDLGLFIRDGYTESDRRLPGSPVCPHAKVVWAECRVTDGLVADPSTAAGGLWFKVRYPEVADSGDYWSYGGFLVPVGHNGSIPECDLVSRA